MAPELVCGARSGECRFPAAWAGWHVCQWGSV